MDKNINIRPIKKTYEYYDENHIFCKKSVKLHIFGVDKYFIAGELASRVDENIFNKSFGEALSEVRAIQSLYRQIEISLIKYSFDHFLNDKEQNEERPETINLCDADGNILNTISTKTTTKDNNKPTETIYNHTH
jgi:hypothetical protein